MKARPERTPGKVSRPCQSLHTHVILFIPPPAGQYNLTADWAAVSAEGIVRQCPECRSDSVIGHGRRRKQAHDENHDWIGIRRGLCTRCERTITFLPPFSLPYTRYSLIARSQALHRYFAEGCSLDLAAPLVKDPNRVPAASTLRRWFHGLDSAERWDRLRQLQPDPLSATTPYGPGMAVRRFPFLQRMMGVVRDWLSGGKVVRYGQWTLTGRTLAHFLQVLLPLRC